jgi:pyruvate dehydrogenase E1 component beta subunit
VPATPHDAKGLLKSSIRDNNPVVFIENQLLYNARGEVADDDYTVPIGRAEVKREGTDVTLYCYLRTLGICLKAAETLEKDGVSVEVVDLRTLRPLDTEAILSSIRKTHRAVIVEEDWPQFGVGPQIVDCIQRYAFDYLDGPILRVTQEDVPMPYSKALEQSALPNEEKVVSSVKQVLAGSGP